GQSIHDRFQYPEGTISTELAVIRLQKHIPQTIAGKLYRKCPIEFRNIFIKELPARPRREAVKGGDLLNSPAAKLLSRIKANDLPKAYDPGKHQDYVDRRMAELTVRQQARVGQLWAPKQRIRPKMVNRGAEFVKVMEHVAKNEK
nr:hypothetical protein [Planctomycetota bacterium]